MVLVITPLETPRKFDLLGQPLATSQKLGGRELVWRDGLVEPGRDQRWGRRFACPRSRQRLDAPTAATAHVTTAQGAFDIRLRDLQGARALSFRDDDVIVQQTPTPQPV